MNGGDGRPGSPKAIRNTGWIPAVVAGAAGGAAAAAIGFPVPWLIGALFAGLIISVAFRKRLALPDGCMAFAQVTVGLTVGLSFSLETVAGLGRHLPAVILVLLLTTAASLANGYLLSRWTALDRSSSLLGTIPGAASAMVAAAQSVGADARVVAVLQYVRLLFILIIVPPLLSAWAGAAGLENLVPMQDAAAALGGEPASSRTPAAALGALPRLAALGVAGAFLGSRLRFPSPRVLGPMVLAVAVATAFPGLVAAGLSVPRPAFSAALLIIGVSVGLRFDREILGALRMAAAIEVALLVGLLAASAALAYLLHLATGIDLATAVMGNIPGALEAMVAVSIDLGADAPIVAAMQTTRSISLLCLGPWIVRGLRGMKGKSA